jgi:DNA-directed RNA polymerase subunit RPC12/RpoP
MADIEYTCTKCGQTFIDTEVNDIHEVMDEDDGEVTFCGGKGRPARDIHPARISGLRAPSDEEYRLTLKEELTKWGFI